MVLATGEATSASYERSDTCAVAACSLIVEAMVSLVLADAILARVGGETMSEVVERCRELRRRAQELGR